MLGRETVCDSRPFETLETARFVGSTTVLARVAAFLTVDGDGNINRRAAPREVLAAASVHSSCAHAPAAHARGWQRGHLSRQIEAVFDVADDGLRLALGARPGAQEPCCSGERGACCRATARQAREAHRRRLQGARDGCRGSGRAGAVDAARAPGAGSGAPSTIVLAVTRVPRSREAQLPLEVEARRAVLRRDADRYFPITGPSPSCRRPALATPARQLEAWVRAIETLGPVKAIVTAPQLGARVLGSGTGSMPAGFGEHGVIQGDEGRLVSARRAPAAAGLASRADAQVPPISMAAVLREALTWSDASLAVQLLDAPLAAGLRRSRQRRLLASLALAAVSLLALLWSADHRRASQLPHSGPRGNAANDSRRPCARDAAHARAFRSVAAARRRCAGTRRTPRRPAALGACCRAMRSCSDSSGTGSSGASRDGRRCTAPRAIARRRRRVPRCGSPRQTSVFSMGSARVLATSSPAHEPARRWHALTASAGCAPTRAARRDGQRRGRGGGIAARAASCRSCGRGARASIAVA
jgi:hypothetical protein